MHISTQYSKDHLLAKTETDSNRQKENCFIIFTQSSDFKAASQAATPEAWPKTQFKALNNNFC